MFAWPTLFALIGLEVRFCTRPGSASGRVLILIAAIPNLVLLPPVIRNMIDGVGLRMAGPLMITVTLFLVVILPLLAPIVVNPGRGMPRNHRMKAHPGFWPMPNPSRLTVISPGWTRVFLI